MEETTASAGTRRAALTAVPRPHAETALRKVGGHWVAVTPDGQLHGFESPDGAVSEVGERIVELVDGKRSVQDIVALLVEEFDVPREVAEVDASRFIQVLADKQVLSF